MQNSRLIISNQLFVAAYVENKLPSTTRLTKDYYSIIITILLFTRRYVREI